MFSWTCLYRNFLYIPYFLRHSLVLKKFTIVLQITYPISYRIIAYPELKRTHKDLSIQKGKEAFSFANATVEFFLPITNLLSSGPFQLFLWTHGFLSTHPLLSRYPNCLIHTCCSNALKDKERSLIVRASPDFPNMIPCGRKKSHIFSSDAVALFMNLHHKSSHTKKHNKNHRIYNPPMNIYVLGKASFTFLNLKLDCLTDRKQHSKEGIYILHTCITTTQAKGD